MATRSFIGKINKDSSITAVYCHFDGYPEHNGKILTENYVTENQVDSLLAGGDMSSLSPALNECAFYKGRGEDQTESRTYPTFELFFRAGRNSWTEYFYVFNYDFWSCYDRNGERVDLHEVITKDDQNDSN